MSGNIRFNEQQLLDALSKWWITVSVMASLLFQLLLLLTGGTRKWNKACRFVAWNAYNWSDYVATTALGGLAQAAVSRDDAHRDEVYALWAPFLLLHLGAPDNISAYAMADAELWKRHGLTMLLQIAIVVYVVANCARSWKFVLLSVCLTALGTLKYAERTFALKRASRTDITESALPIYKYMLVEDRFQYLENKGPAFSSQFANNQLRARGAGSNGPDRYQYFYILHGEKQWLRNFLRAGKSSYIHDYSNAADLTPEFVTLEDILSSPELITSQMPSIVMLCVGFALFKLYKRRLCILYMYEWRAEKTRELFLGKHVFQDVQKLMFALDVELRFLFDSLYTKAGDTAFSKAGVTLRILTTILLMASAVFILGGSLDLHDQAIKQAREVTICLISAAIVIEVYQVARLLLSDWCKVWLACQYILAGKKPGRSSLGLISMRGVWRPSLILRVLKLLSSFRRHKYWINRIGQYALIAETGKLSVWQNINGKLHATAARVMAQLGGGVQQPEYYVQSKQVVDEAKRYVLSRLVQACRRLPPEMKLVSLEWFLPLYEGSQRDIVQAALSRNGFYCDFEHLVVNWHLATCVCELFETSEGLGSRPPDRSDVSQQQPTEACEEAGSSIEESTEDFHDVFGNQPINESTDEEVDIRVSRLLSRYLMYLMVHKAELLPCHADIARQLAADTQRELRDAKLIGPWQVESIKPLLDEERNDRLPFNLRDGMMVANRLQSLNRAQRWSLIGSVWVNVLMCAAAHNKPVEQLEQLTVGGEFVTHLWVLLGHLGCGGQ